MRREFVFGMVAALAATLAAVVVYSALEKQRAELRKAALGTVEIAVAARYLPLGTKIEPGAVKFARWSRESLPPGAVTDQTSLMSSIVKDSFVENEPIVTSKLYSGQKVGGILPLLIPAGMRAMSLAVNEVSDVAGFILPQARLDVLVSVQEQNQKSFSKVVLQNLEVLAVAQQIAGDKDEPQLVKVVTLLVTPQQSERLALAGHEGVLRLALRNYTDDKIVPTNGVDTDALMRPDSTAPMAVAKLQSPLARAHGAPFAQMDVEIVRDGTHREIVTFVKGTSTRRLSRDREPSPASQ